jgi:hypothetical protein
MDTDMEMDMDMEIGHAHEHGRTLNMNTVERQILMSDVGSVSCRNEIEIELIGRMPDIRYHRISPTKFPMRVITYAPNQPSIFFVDSKSWSLNAVLKGLSHQIFKAFL